MEAKQVKVKILALSLAAVALVEAGLVFSKAAFNPMLRLGAARLLELGLVVWMVHAVGGGVASIGLDRGQWLAGLRRGLLWSAGFGALSGIALGALFMAGRCISCSHEAQASVRVIGTCLATGEAAGLAAALQVSHGDCDAAAVNAARERLVR